MFPEARIHSFEPFPESYGKLQSEIEGKANIFAHNIAISDKDGKALFNSNAQSTANSLLSSDEKGSEYWGNDVLDTKSQIEVETTSLDSFCTNNNIDSIDILKIDTQGAEYQVFQGAKDMLTRNAIGLIYTEIIICPTYKGQHALYEYLSLLASFGYELLDIYNQVRQHNQLIQVDVIFLPDAVKQAL